MAVSSDIKLRLYNGALRRLGDRRLASLSENREPRRVLDDTWGSADEIVKWALERGEWNFALRTVEVDYNPSVTPGFGFTRAFDKPGDFRRLAGLSADEFMHTPLTNAQYLDEAGYWFSDYDVLYVRYVSDGTDYGLNSALWTETFKEFLELKLAYENCVRLTDSKTFKAQIQNDYKDALKIAKSHDAMAEGVKKFPAGSWVMSRGASRSGE